MNGSSQQKRTPAGPTRTSAHGANHDAWTSPLVYMLIFVCFGMFVLALFSGKYQRRQAKIEQRFHGIETMHGRSGQPTAGQGTQLRTPDTQPLLITLRPLFITLGTLALLAAVTLYWREARRRAGAVSSPNPPE